MSTKAIKTWEKERGLIILGDVDPTQRVNEDEFLELTADLNNVVGVDHEARTKFLKDNGHEVTRENMVNIDLTVRSEENNS